MDKKKSIKNLVVVLIAVVLLGLLWAFVKNQVTTTPIYIVVDTFVLIIPSIILIPGIICYIAYFFVNDAKIKSALKISSLCIAAFCVVFSVSFFAAVFVNSGSEKTSSYKEPPRVNTAWVILSICLITRLSVRITSCIQMAF